MRYIIAAIFACTLTSPGFASMITETAEILTKGEIIAKVQADERTGASREYLAVKYKKQLYICTIFSGKAGYQFLCAKNSEGMF